LHGISALKSSNALLYILAAQYALDLDVQDSFILNEKGNICEASGANIFIVLDGKLITPALDEGCVDGVMRKIVWQLAGENSMEISEGTITESHLEFASEVFLTNATRGIVYVHKFGKKLFEIQYAKKLLKALNEAITGGRF
jgi:branched-chain amino acid aminotransferase